MLKNKYHFEFPQLYKTLLEDRMFDYTAPQYLLDYKFFGADLEPFSFEESLQNYEDFPFWDKDPSKQIFPFAHESIGQTAWSRKSQLCIRKEAGKVSWTKACSFAPEDVVLIALPSYGGRVPAAAVQL